MWKELQLRQRGLDHYREKNVHPHEHVKQWPHVFLQHRQEQPSIPLLWFRGIQGDKSEPLLDVEESITKLREHSLLEMRKLWSRLLSPLGEAFNQFFLFATELGGRDDMYAYFEVAASISS